MEQKVEKPLAIIIKGNSKYTGNHRVKPLARAFYEEIKQILENKGYRVEFDAGLPYTIPKIYSKVWVGHSRGVDRLRFAPKGVQTVALQCMDHDQEFKSVTERGMSPLHYQLSDADRANLEAIPTAV
jgi:hypothetical protein